MAGNERHGNYRLLLLVIMAISAAGAGLYIMNQTQESTNQSLPTSIETRDNQKVIGVSADHPLAVAAGMDVLRKGGNAVDAAIAVSYMLAVVEPFASGPGGGGIMLVVPADASKAVVYDYLSTCPGAFNTDTTSSCIPGFVAGLDAAHRDFGTVSMDKLMEPAIRTAQDGFPINESISKRLSYAQYKLKGAGVEVFFPGGRPLVKGDVLQQTMLAESLLAIAREGPMAFYQGSLAEQIVDAGTGIDSTSLAAYKVVARLPVQTSFKGYTILAPPPPAAGITVLQCLNLGIDYEMERFPYGSADYITHFAYINQAAYTDRLKYIADPAYLPVNSKWLLSAGHLAELGQLDSSAVSADALPNENQDEKGLTNTTCFVIIDQYGNMVSVTNSIDTAFGCGQYVSGFFLNDGFSNFNTSSKSINYPVAGKRARTYICPLAVISEGRPVMALGTPGGVTIPQTLQEVLYLHIVYGMDLQAAVDKPRFYTEDNNTVYTEGDFEPDAVRVIQEQQQLSVIAYANHLFFGSVNAIHVESGMAQTGSDKRREAAAAIEIAPGL